MKEVRIVAEGSFEDYKESFYLDDKYIGCSHNTPSMIENLFGELGIKVNITTGTLYENRTEYLVVDEQFKSTERPGTWLMFENGCIGLIMDNEWIKLQIPVGMSIPEHGQLGEYKVLSQSFPEAN